ncbi:hypothetical protein PV325_007137 [Microctonus aethiopoides]|nr:hypothetical protein PV325_007137 [Microctonus aethiopoides]KAK0092181.1 hypothetical protein PV326_001991 [Microctonus aethiopoides]
MDLLTAIKSQSKRGRREAKLQNRTLVFTTKLARVSGACEFPQKWEGQWFQSGKPSPVNINATMLGEKRCIEKDKDRYSVYDSLSSENCYRCLIINDRHVNAIQFREDESRLIQISLLSLAYPQFAIRTMRRQKNSQVERLDSGICW